MSDPTNTSGDDGEQPGWLDSLWTDAKDDASSAAKYVTNKGALAYAAYEDATNPYNAIALASGGTPVALNYDMTKASQDIEAGVDPLTALAQTNVDVAAAAADPNNANANAFGDAGNKLVDTAKQLGGNGLTILGWLTKPWVLASIAGVIALAVVAPYVTPFLKKAS